MDRTRVVVGLDVAVSRPTVAVALRADRRALRVTGWHEAVEGEPGDRARLLDWIGDQRPAAVAVAAAQRPRRATGAAPIRHADAELLRRRIAVAPAPTRERSEQAGRRYDHVRAGWAYFRELRRRGHDVATPGALPNAFGQAPAVLEVYPHAGFVTLLGGTPPPRGTREGAHVRLLALRRLGLQWDEYYDVVSLDALMTAFTAWRFLQGLASSLGDERDGCVWLPVPAHDVTDTYAPLSPTAARAAVGRLSAT